MNTTLILRYKSSYMFQLYIYSHYQAVYKKIRRSRWLCGLMRGTTVACFLRLGGSKLDRSWASVSCDC